MQNTPRWSTPVELSLGVLGVVGEVAALVSARDWLIWISATCFLILSILLAYSVGHLDRHVRVMRHLTDVIPHFDDDVGAFQRVQHSYQYLGASGRTIYPAFERILAERPHGQGLTARFLLIHPGSESALVNCRLCDGAATADDAGRLSRTIENFAEQYLALDRAQCRVEVRFYRACLHYWAHYLDDQEAIVGLRLRGESGVDSTALHLRRGSGENKLYRLFREQFEDLWNAPDTVRAEDYFAAKGGKAVAAVAP